jgi:uncharacterized protein (DUF1330 family)
MEHTMNRHIALGLTGIISAALGAAAVQGLHAQAKPKAYTVTEVEVTDSAALAAYVPLVVGAIKTAGGRSFNTPGGKIIGFVGEAPKRVGINEFDSLEQAQAFLNSPAYKNLAPQRDKAEKIMRQYIVESTGI